jgi:uncharacterized Zn finger protein (UPF0148 family)
MSIKGTYPDDECPDCGDPIAADAVDGDACPNCGHVFWSSDEPDPPTGPENGGATPNDKEQT